MYSDTGLSCQEESEVSEKKNEVAIPEGKKSKSAEASARIIPQTPFGTKQPSPGQNWD
jgi:hypothetical protein